MRGAPKLLATFATTIVLAGAGCGGDGAKTAASSTQTPPRAEPVLATQGALRTFAGALDHPVYWAKGEAPGKYELTQADQRTYIRYLPTDVEIGDPRADFLTVGTYAQVDAATSVDDAAKRGGSKSEKLPDGTLVVVRADQPKSAFFAVPRKPYLVEVYSPTPGQAADLVRAGKIVPIG